MQVLPAGRDAVLVEVAGTEEVLALHAALGELVAAGRAPGVTELVPAARTLLVAFDRDVTGPAALTDLLAGVDLSPRPVPAAEVLDVPVTYDGPDLADVAARLGMEPDQFVTWHTGRAWQVAFTGFAPGFGYLVSPGHRTPVERLASPRTRVPAGSVAMADLFTGVYPLATPGGWRIVGRTDAVLLDLDREPAATLHPGRGVRFVVA